MTLNITRISTNKYSFGSKNFVNTAVDQSIQTTEMYLYNAWLKALGGALLKDPSIKEESLLKIYHQPPRALKDSANFQNNVSFWVMQ